MAQEITPRISQRGVWLGYQPMLISPAGGSYRIGGSAQALSARLFVNGDLRYEIWVWCGGTGSASGDHTFYGSYSGSNLSVTAPWIHWEYWR